MSNKKETTTKKTSVKGAVIWTAIVTTLIIGLVTTTHVLAYNAGVNSEKSINEQVQSQVEQLTAVKEEQPKK